MICLDGELGQFCSRCGRWIGEREPVFVAVSSRQNPHAGRIAWERDGICKECIEKENVSNLDTK